MQEAWAYQAQPTRCINFVQFLDVGGYVFIPSLSNFGQCTLTLPRHAAHAPISFRLDVPQAQGVYINR